MTPSPLHPTDAADKANVALLPCPFCGGTPELMDTLPGGSYWYRCEECAGETEGGKTHAEAIAAWNRRAPALLPADVAELVERLESHMGKQDVPVLLRDYRLAATTISAFSARLERADEVIRPFAAVAERIHERTKDSRLLDVMTAGARLTVGHVRAALAWKEGR